MPINKATEILELHLMREETQLQNRLEQERPILKKNSKSIN